MTRINKHQVSVTEPITLGDLRWLVDACDSMIDETKVQVTPHRELGQRGDYDPTKITVEGEPS